MPVLTNPKHELFAQELAKGKTATEATNCSDHQLTECEGLEANYWDITGMMVEMLAELEGRPHRKHGLILLPGAL